MQNRRTGRGSRTMWDDGCLFTRLVGSLAVTFSKFGEVVCSEQLKHKAGVAKTSTHHVGTGW